MSERERGYESGHTVGSAERRPRAAAPPVQVTDLGALTARVSTEQTPHDSTYPADALRKPAGSGQMLRVIRQGGLAADQQTNGEVVTEVLTGEVAVKGQGAAHVLRTGMLL